MNKKGFTLVELLAVIAIIAILGTMGVAAVLKIYNNNINKTMVVQENNIAEASKTYLEDYCIDPIDNTYECPDSYKNNESIKYVCLSDLQDNIKDNYVNKTTYKKSDCKGIITFTENKDGEYLNAKTYLYCGYDKNKKEYEYMTDSSLDISKYSRCDIASGIKGEGETTTTTTTTKVVPAVACTYNGTLKQGTEYVNGQYTYRYMQDGDFPSSGLTWKNMSTKGWGVQLTDKKSTDPVTSEVCTTINGIPVTSASYAFRDSKAVSIDLSSFDNNQITDMNHMFSWSDVRSMDLNYLNTSKVTNMSGMFNGVSITKLDIQALDTRNVTDMSSMFNSAYIKDADFSKLNTSKVTNMDSMFYKFRTNSDTLDVSNFDTSKVTDMSSTFSDLEFTSIKGIEKLDTSNVTRMSCMFCFSEMETIDVSHFNTSNVRIMSDVFAYTFVDTLDLSNFDTSKVTHIGGLFASSTVQEIKGLEKFNTSNVTNMGSMFMSTGLKTLDLSSFDTSNVTDMGAMFAYASATEIKGLEKFDTSKVNNMNDMFRKSKIKTLNLNSFDTSNVVYMSSMFKNSLSETIDLTSFDTSNVKYMSEMFSNSTTQEIKGLEKFNTSNVIRMNGMFSYSSIPTLNLSSFDISKVENMKDMFYNAKATTGYAKDSKTAAKFNDSTITKIPSTLVFTTK